MVSQLGRRSKKGSLQDIFFAVGALLFFAIVVLFGFKISTEINNQVQSLDIIPDIAKQNSAELLNHYNTTVDNSALMVTVFTAITILILAAMVRIHPIFIPIYFIGLGFLIFFAGVASNIYQEMASNPQLILQADQLVLITNILTFLPMIIAVIGTLLMVVMFKSWQIARQ